MKRALCLLLVLAAAPAGAQLYRWVDDKGVVNYGEKPPAGRNATPVNAQPAGTIESRAVRETRLEAPVDAKPVAPAVSAARGMPFEVFMRLEAGMPEGELTLRAGKPDQETVDNFRGDVVKTWYYYPTTGNPFLTVVTLRGGRIANLERNRKTF